MPMYPISARPGRCPTCPTCVPPFLSERTFGALKAMNMPFARSGVARTAPTMDRSSRILRKV